MLIAPEGFQHLHREGWVDQFDEWQPAHSWAAEKCILYGAHPHTSVRLRLKVYGRSNFSWPERCRPRSWRADLKMEDFEQEVARGLCRTLKEAEEKAEALDLTEPLKLLLGAFYGRGEALSVWTEKNGTFEPLLTLFGRWHDYTVLSWGKFVCGGFTLGKRAYWTEVDRNGYGYASGSSPALRERVKELQPWTGLQDSQGAES